MTDLRIITTNGAAAILEEAAVQNFADSLRGRLLQPGESGYDEGRQVWNGMIDRRPALIARCPGSPTSSRWCVLPALTGCWCPSAAAVTTSPATPSARAA